MIRRYSIKTFPGQAFSALKYSRELPPETAKAGVVGDVLKVVEI